MCHDDKELSLKLRKESYDRRSQVEFGLIGPNDGRGSIGATPLNSWGGQERWASPKPHSWDIGEVQGCIHQQVVHKNNRQGVEFFFAQQEIQFLSYVVTNEGYGWT